MVDVLHGISHVYVAIVAVLRSACIVRSASIEYTVSHRN